MEVLKEMPRRDPINGTFELTVRCNLKCKMCLFRHDDSENAEIIAKEKTAEEWIDMARQVAEAGTLNLLITGGEPMLRPDFCEIYEGIYKQGFFITLYTNATLVTSKIMATLKKYPPHIIGVTLYGSSPEIYEKVCGSGYGFDRALKGIKELRTLPSKMEYRTTIIKDNYDDLPNIEQLLGYITDDKYKLSISSHVFKAVRGGIADVDSCRLSAKEIVKLNIDTKIRRVKKDIIRLGLNPKDFKIEQKEPNKVTDTTSVKTRVSLLGCDAGMESYTISHNGLLLGCQMLGTFYTNPFDYGFNTAWKKYPLEVKIPEINTDCSNCENIEYCKSCYAQRYAESGQLNGFSDYMCETTKESIKYTKNIKGGIFDEKL